MTRAVITYILQTGWIIDSNATLLSRPFYWPIDGYDMFIAKASSTEARRTYDIFTAA
jgi:hypothetical protein